MMLHWGALAGAPALLRGRFKLFGQSNMQHSARAIQLVTETTVVDLLNQFRQPDYSDKPSNRVELWLSNPETFRAADAVTYQESGIKVFALGTYAPDYPE